MSIKILIADDHQLFREGLFNLLSAAENIDIIGQAENGKETIKLARKLQPDIVIMDIGMPVINGIEATTILKKELPDIRVIALSMHSDKNYIKGMFEAGAYGYLFKNCAYDELLEAINTVYDGRKYLDDEITEVVIHDYLGKEKNIPVSDPQLSEREAEILKLFAEGKSSREIAELLFVSVKTVGSHRQHIFQKLELGSTADLVKYALKRGIITLE